MMKRREFVVASASMAGALIPSWSRAAQPCPPPQVSVAGGTSASTTCAIIPAGGSYTTDFNLSENPISEGGAWLSGAVAPRTQVQTGNGNAYGTMVSFNGRDYPDSVACLAGPFPANQQITATLYNNGAVSGLEVELLLRCDFSLTRAFCYELDLVLSGGHVSWVRWDMTTANPNTYQVLVAGPPGSNIHFNDGAVWTARIVGTVLTAICDGVTVLTYDTANDGVKYSGGKPGIGFWNETGSSANSPKFAWKNFAAVSL
jgi:hypothetical protein